MCSVGCPAAAKNVTHRALFVSTYEKSVSPKQRDPTIGSVLLHMKATEPRHPPDEQRRAPHEWASDPQRERERGGSRSEEHTSELQSH